MANRIVLSGSRGMSLISTSMIPVIVSLLFVSGCQKTARNLSLDQPKAREACTTFLTAWKEGKQVADLKPKIIGRDSDWELGKKLMSFEFLPEERSDGANLHLKVRRTVTDKEGREEIQEVAFVVGTSPVITVFRSDE